MLATFLLITSLPSVLLMSMSPHKFCPATPVVTINISTDENGSQEQITAVPSQTASGDDYLYFEKPTVINFHCVANRPIELVTDILMPYVVQNVEFIRDVGDVFDSSTYCYVITFKAGPDFRATGKYTCSLIENKNQFSSIFIFVDGDTGSILLNNDYPFDIEGIADDDGWITIPCITTNPSLVPTIIKANQLRNNAMEELQLEPNVVEYSTGIGFKIKAMSPQCCSKHYRCELNKAKVGETVVNSETSVTLYKTEALTGKAFYRASPSDFVLGHNEGSETKLRHLLDTKITLRCESNTGIILGVDPPPPTENVQFQASYSPRLNSFYEYYAELSLNVQKVGVLTVLCKLESNHQPLHKWVITTVTEEEFHHSVGIHIVPDKRYPITCFSPYATSPVISIIRCNDSINCGIADKFASRILKPGREKLSNFPYDVIEGHSSCVRNREASNALGCAEVSPHLWSFRGIVKCREEHKDNSYIVYTQHFLIGLHNIIVSLPEHASMESGNLTEDSTILEMDSFKSTLYVDEEITVKCTASYGVFSVGIQIMFQLQDNTNLTGKNFTRLVFTETLMDNVITYEGKLKITAQDIRRIWCFAPIWNSANWRSIFKDVTILPGVHPEIKGGMETELVSWGIGTTGYQLRCEVGGEPMPTVRWTKDGETLTTNNTKVLNMSTIDNSTVLELETIVVAHQGTYTCEATNVKGTIAKKFEVHISGTENIALYAGITSVVVVVAIIIISVLIKLLRNRSATIEKLSDQEIHEFEFGNQSLAKKFAELNENARYLPYKQDFEIAKSKLEFKEDEVLGAGAFGLVLKGYLTRHSERIPVAIKTVRSNVDISQLRNLLGEIKILMYIGQHSNVIGLVGAITRDLREGKLHVVVEYCAHGNLLDFLRESRDNFVNQIFNGRLDFKKGSAANTSNLRPGSNFSTNSWKIDDFLPQPKKTPYRKNSSCPVKTADLITWAMQIADGMIYLGSKNVIHGDLATRNLLLTKTYTVKITDFGLSAHLYDYTNYIKKTKEEPVPWRWLSVEAIRDSKFSIATDIWAFGVTLWEIFTLAEVPYQGFSWGKEFVDKLFDGLRLTQPTYTTDEIFRQMEKCWENDPLRRIPFNTSRDFFSSLLSASSSTSK